MKFIQQLFPKFLFFLFGAAIVMVSLFSANRVFSQGEELELTRRKLYFQEDILPDHLLYPVFMAFDRLRLELAPPVESVDLQLVYAWKRLEYTQQLLEQGYQSLSFSTLTKAYKYYNAGLAEAQSVPLRPNQQQFLAEDAQLFREKAAELNSSFTNSQREELMHLESEHAVLTQFFIESL